MELKKKVEALLFSSGKKMSVGELCKLCSVKEPELREAIALLKKEYNDKDGSLMIIDEADGWKLTIHDSYAPVVQNVVAETELPKSVMETLAVIAWKSPVLQSDVIKVRTNKAYDHIGELEEAGFVVKKKHGRSYMLKLGDRFFQYFDLRHKQEMVQKFEAAGLKKKEPEQKTLVAENFSGLPGVYEIADDFAEIKQAEKTAAVEKEIGKIDELMKEPDDDSES